MEADSRTTEFLREETVKYVSKDELQTGSDILPCQAFPAILVAQMEHLTAAKKLADRHKYELGFINQAILQKAIESNSLLVAPCPNIGNSVNAELELVGLVHFYVRRDNVVTLCNIVVAQVYQRTGLGRRLFEELVRLTCSMVKTQIRLKCPAELPANLFYERLGLKIVAVEPGKHRPLNVWVYTVNV